MPSALSITSLKDLSDNETFRGGNCVFVAPDERLAEIRSAFLQFGVKNDVFGVREAKGLEFASVAVIGFFEYFEQQGSCRYWENVLRWLFSDKGITKTESGEKIAGKFLECCDYQLTHPELEDQAMMLYTAMTRARGNLYFIEIDESGKKGKKASLADFAFRQFKNLRLLQLVNKIDEGEADMTPEQVSAGKREPALSNIRAFTVSSPSKNSRTMYLSFSVLSCPFMSLCCPFMSLCKSTKFAGFCSVSKQSINLTAVSRLTKSRTSSRKRPSIFNRTKATTNIFSTSATSTFVLF